MKSVKGQLERVKPGDITTTRVMTVEGELDDISGSGQTKAALEMCTGVPAGHKKHFEAMGAGHYGIFSGRRWREAVYPAVKAFILEANKDLKKVEIVPVAQVNRAQAAPKNIAFVKPVAKPVAKPIAKPITKAVAKPAPAKTARAK